MTFLPSQKTTLTQTKAHIAVESSANAIESFRNHDFIREHNQDQYNKMRETLRKVTDDETSNEEMADILLKLLLRTKGAPSTSIAGKTSVEGFHSLDAAAFIKEGMSWARQIDHKGKGKETDDSTRAIVTKSKSGFKGYPTAPVSSSRRQRLQANIPESAGSKQNPESYKNIPESIESTTTLKSVVDGSGSEGDCSESEEDVFYDFDWNNPLDWPKRMPIPPPIRLLFEKCYCRGIFLLR